MQSAMNHAGVENTYRRWAPFYDLVFGPLFEQPRRSAVAACEQVGGRVLEVGVGTGLSLPFYSPRMRVVGIDISAPMLEKARRRVALRRLEHVEALELMDAQRLTFGDGTFDVVMAQYVVNTVPDPVAALDEFVRVLRPGGELIVVNRVGAKEGARRRIEHALQPLSERLGWRFEFPWARFETWLAGRPDITLIERRPMPPFGHFALIRFGKLSEAKAVATASPAAH